MEGTRVIAFANQKGGTGKSTTCGGFAEALIGRGYQVLVIDLDPQGNISFTMGADASLPGSDSLLEPGGPKGSLGAWVQHPSYTDLVCSGSMDDGNALLIREQEIATDTAGGSWRLADAIEGFAGSYDFILLDTPPNMGPLTVNALCAADDLVIPCDMDIQSVKGFDVFLGYARTFQRRMNPRLSIAGVVMTQYRSGVNSAAELLSGMSEKCKRDGVRLFHSTLRSTDVVKRAHRDGIGLYDAVKSRKGSSRIDVDLEHLIDEYLVSIGR